ncbi:trypsin-like serine protease [Acetobacter sp. AN02]|uniref:trypsin-like serine peptidase n=1 Tax=Acetobacter sp. AN02 TaxID=2894186 RepID=UPI002434128B|nr:trypsin-like serine protease [Acetobacter sp. AN02]MDG6094726.1 trypsin-like serine protease [Acetobacter sp. AN02]
MASDGPRMMYPGRAALLLLMAWIITPAARAEPATRNQVLPGVGTTDRRLPVSTEAMPWKAVVRVQTELGGRCTGFLIAPAVVLTAAHCLWIPKTGNYVFPPHIHVLTGYSLGQYRDHARVRRIVIPPAYVPKIRQDQTTGPDRAVLILDHAVARPDSVLPLLRGLPISGEAAMLGGYEQDRRERLMADTACHITTPQPLPDGRELIGHDCSATRGSSGGPLLVRQDNQWVAAGINVRAWTEDNGGLAEPCYDEQAIKDSTTGNGQ